MDPRPLVVIQIVDNDSVCPPAQGAFGASGTTVGSALKDPRDGLPTSRIFVVGQFGSVPTGLKTLAAAQRRSVGGTGPCAALDPQGHGVPREVRLRGRPRGRLPRCWRCTWDDGSIGNAVDLRAYIAPDLNHYSVAGHAVAARIASRALRTGPALSDRFGKGCQRPSQLLVDVAGACAVQCL